MTPGAQPANTYAIAMMALAMSALAANDAAMKAASADLGAAEIIFFRGLVLCAALVIGIRLSGAAFSFQGLTERWSLVRATGDVCATYLFINALALVPIALATTLVFIFPVILTALSGPLFGERVGPWRWFAVTMGFAGVVIVTAPGASAWRSELLLPLGAAVMVVMRDVATRYIPASVSTGQVALTTAIAGTAGGFAGTVLGWAGHGGSPPSGGIAGLMLLAGVLIAISHFTYVIAIRRGELSLVAPVQYVIIVWAVIFGAVIWGEIPSGREFAGGLIIVASGVLILYREGVRRRRHGLDRSSAATQPRPTGEQGDDQSS